MSRKEKVIGYTGYSKEQLVDEIHRVIGNYNNLVDVEERQFRILQRFSSKLLEKKITWTVEDNGQIVFRDYVTGTVQDG